MLCILFIWFSALFLEPWGGAAYAFLHHSLRILSLDVITRLCDIVSNRILSLEDINLN